MNAHHLCTDQLLAALHNGARDSPVGDETAALDLLAWHGVWLQRETVRDRIIVKSDPVQTGMHGDVAALFDEEDPLIGSALSQAQPADSNAQDAAILRIASSIASRHPVHLHGAIITLDALHAAAVALTVLRVAGIHDAVIRVRRPMSFPRGYRVVDHEGRLLHEADTAPTPQWFELGPVWPGYEAKGLH